MEKFDGRFQLADAVGDGTLDSLYLQGTGITDAGLMRLSRLGGLISLRLRDP